MKNQKLKKQKPARKDFSAGGIVWDPDAGKVFLIKVRNLLKEVRWTFPKGHPDAGESDTEAALREVREETGWETEIIKPLTDVQYCYRHKGEMFDKTVRWFLMKPVKKVGEPDPNEVLESGWLTPKEARTLVSYKSDTTLLKKMEEEIKQI